MNEKSNTGLSRHHGWNLRQTELLRTFLFWTLWSLRFLGVLVNSFLCRRCCTRQHRCESKGEFRRDASNTSKSSQGSLGELVMIGFGDLREDYHSRSFRVSGRLNKSHSHQSACRVRRL